MHGGDVRPLQTGDCFHPTAVTSVTCHTHPNRFDATLQTHAMKPFIRRLIVFVFFLCTFDFMCVHLLFGNNPPMALPSTIRTFAARSSIVISSVNAFGAISVYSMHSRCSCAVVVVRQTVIFQQINFTPSQLLSSI